MARPDECAILSINWKGSNKPRFLVTFLPLFAALRPGILRLVSCICLVLALLPLTVGGASSYNRTTNNLSADRTFWVSCGLFATFRLREWFDFQVVWCCVTIVDSESLLQVISEDILLSSLITYESIDWICFGLNPPCSLQAHVGAFILITLALYAYVGKRLSSFWDKSAINCNSLIFYVNVNTQLEEIERVFFWISKGMLVLVDRFICSLSARLTWVFERKRDAYIAAKHFHNTVCIHLWLFYLT